MKKTPIFIFVIILLVTIFDYYIITVSGKDESISAYFIRWAYEMPLFPFGLGIVVGHLFWSFDIKKLYVDKFNKEKK